ncbi:hypothetical protein [Pseudopontixanthobacter vadosimaris]|uniref:hypothetical protein n=1 Tax=Pseudopontixanthobacter vadosimaris TaxID=2726450 RepID=UPI00197C0716|nr:hypothetical protein [Pseudopontixanthobacter vadosimaris]
MVKKSAAGPKRRRTNPHWRKPFLEALAQTSNVAAAARGAGVDVSATYRLRRQNAEFASAWFDALCEGYDNLEMDLLHRLRSGELDGGEKGKARARRKFDNGTAFRLLAAHRETVKRQRAIREIEDEEAVFASINAKLDAMQARQKTITAIVAEDGVYRVSGQERGDAADGTPS